MELSVRGIIDLATHEGLVPVRYLDGVGVWTIGLGHTKAAGSPDPSTFKGKLTEEECLNLFMRDKAKYERRVNKALGGRAIPQTAFDALVSFDYNTGGISRASFLKSYLNGDMKEAERRFNWWRKPAMVVPRRMKEADLLFRGEYSSSGARVPVYKTTSKHKPIFSHTKDIRQWAKSMGQNPIADGMPGDAPEWINPVPVGKSKSKNSPASDNLFGILIVVAAIGGLVALMWKKIKSKFKKDEDE